MNTNTKPKWLTLGLVAMLALISIAGVKVSRMTRTRGLQTNSLFLVSTQDANGRWHSVHIHENDLATNILFTTHFSAFNGWLWLTNGRIVIVTNGLTGQFLTYSNGVPQWIDVTPGGGAGDVTTAQLLIVSNITITASNKFETETSNLEGATNGLTTRVSNLDGSTNALNTRVNNLDGATNGLTTRASNLEGATNGLNTRTGNLEGATNGLNSGVNGIISRAITNTHTVPVTLNTNLDVLGRSTNHNNLTVHGGNIRLFATNGTAPSLTLQDYGTAFPQIVQQNANGTEISPTAVTSGDVIGQYAISGFGDTIHKSAFSIRPSATGTFSDSTAPTLVRFGVGDAAGTSLGRAAAFWSAYNFTNDVNVSVSSNLWVSGVQTNSSSLHAGALTSAGLFAGLGSGSFFTNELYVRGTNYSTTLKLNGGQTNNAVAVVLGDTNVVGHPSVTVTELGFLDGLTELLTSALGRAVTNVVSLSTTNAVSKPITNSFDGKTLTLRGLEAGANITLTANASNYVIASSAGGSVASKTNDVAAGTQNTLNWTNNLDLLWVLTEQSGASRVDIEGRIQNDAVDFAQMQNITTDRILGRDTAGTGDIEELQLDATSLEFNGSGTIRRSALTGDITATAGSGVTDLSANAVEDSELRDSAGTSVIGRSTTSTGDPGDIVAAANGYMLWRTNSVLQFSKGNLTNDSFANLALSSVYQGQAPMFHDSTGLITNRSTLSETIGPHDNIYWDDFWGRIPVNTTNLGTMPSGDLWHQFSGDAASQITISNGMARGHGANNSQTPFYNARSNSTARMEITRVGGKIHPLTNPGGFGLQGFGAIILSDAWPSFTGDANWCHIALYEHAISIEKGSGEAMYQFFFDVALPKNITHNFEIQWSSNTVWWTFGPYSDSFTHKDWYLHSQKDFTIYRVDSCTTNNIVNQWDSVWGGYVRPDKVAQARQFYASLPHFNGSNGVSAVALTNNLDLDLGVFKSLTNRVGTNLTYNISNITQNARMEIVLKGLGAGSYSNRVTFNVTNGVNLKFPNWATNGNYDILVRPGFQYDVYGRADDATNMSIYVSTDDIYVPVSSVYHGAINSGISNLVSTNILIVNAGISNLVATNIAIRAGSSASNATVGGVMYKKTTIPAFTNLNTTIATYTNAGQFIVPGNTMTNTDDSIITTWRGSLLAGTNAIRIVYGYQTVLDTGSFTNTTTAFEAGMQVSRTGNVGGLVDAYVRLVQSVGALTSITGGLISTNTVLTCTNGANVTNVLQVASNRAGAVSNNWMRVEFEPASR